MMCPLCDHEESSEFFRADNYLSHQCSHCDVIYVDQSFILANDVEQSRYAEHNNDPSDERYLNFLTQCLSPIKDKLTSEIKALDFGCGPGPAMPTILSTYKIQCDLYDPYFHNEWPTEQYDLITCTEVIEHMNRPAETLPKLNSLLKKGAVLTVMTHFYDKSIKYDTWYYKNDPTHVVIYTHKTIPVLEKMFNWKNIFLSDRVACFIKQ